MLKVIKFAYSNGLVINDNSQTEPTLLYVCCIKFPFRGMFHSISTFGNRKCHSDTTVDTTAIETLRVYNSESCV